MVHVVLLDEYGDEFEDEPTLGSLQWTPSAQQSWNRIQEVEQSVP